MQQLRRGLPPFGTVVDGRRRGRRGRESTNLILKIYDQRKNVHTVKGKLIAMLRSSPHGFGMTFRMWKIWEFFLRFS